MSGKNIKIKNSEAEIESEIPWEVLDGHKMDVLEELRKDFEAPGFRKGHVPMDIFVKHVDEHHVLEDAAQRALEDAYPALIAEHELEPLGRPEVAITKLAKGNPLGFRVRVGIVPEIKLPDYLKIARDAVGPETKIEVTSEEVEKVVDELRTLRRDKNAPADSPLQDLTDDFVKTLGKFESVEDFKSKIKENLAMEKENEKVRERREKIAEALGQKTKISLSDKLLDAEAEAIQEKLVLDLEKAKIPMEDYLSKMGKTSEALFKENREWAERQLKTRFIFEAIARKENLKADPDELALQVQYLRGQHPQANPDSLKRYAEALMVNELVLRFLETTASPQKK